VERSGRFVVKKMKDLAAVLCLFGIAAVLGLPSHMVTRLSHDERLFDAEGMIDIPMTRIISDDHHQFERRAWPLNAAEAVSEDEFDESKIEGSVVMLVNHKTTQYVAPFYIGTPPEKFTLILDTGSSNMWVYGSACHTDVCMAHKRFDHRFLLPKLISLNLWQL
jgi:hypothetical protein